MVETIRKGYWKADAETEKKLLTEYIESVNRHGVGCAEHTCGNPRLSKYTMDRAKALGIPVPAIEGFQQAMEKAIGSRISAASAATEKFVERNEAAPPTPSQITQTPTKQVLAPLQGYLMDVKEQTPHASRSSKATASSQDWYSLWVSLPVLLSLFAWRRYRREH